MSGRLRQYHNSFRTAELEYNRKKSQLAKEYRRLMSIAAKESNWKQFDALAHDLIKNLGEEYNVSKIGLETLHKRKLKTYIKKLN